MTRLSFRFRHPVRRDLTLAIAGLAAVISSACAAASVSSVVSCPPSIQSQQQAANPAAGWQAVPGNGSNRLVYVELYDGPPDGEQAIEPDESVEVAAEQRWIWRFRGQPSPEGLWLLCGYQQTRVRLVRRLPDAITVCTQVNSRDPNRAVLLLSQECH